MYISVRERENKVNILELKSAPPKVPVYLETVNRTLFRDTVFVDVTKVR